MEDTPPAPTMHCACGDELKVTVDGEDFFANCLGCGVEYYIMTISPAFYEVK